MKTWIIGGVKPVLLLSIITLFQLQSFAGELSKKTYWYVNGERQNYWLDDAIYVKGRTEMLPILGYTAKAEDNVDVNTYDGTVVQRVELNADALTNVSQTPGIDRLWAVYPTRDAAPVFIDNELLVTFQDPFIGPDDIHAFMDANDLEWLNPELVNYPAGVRYVYIFKATDLSKEENPASLAASMFEHQSKVVYSVQPNRVNLLTINSNSFIDNPSFYKSWHLENTGQNLYCTTQGGTNSADIKVTEAWGAGYTGQGIRVAVVDVGGFDYNHPDLQGQMDEGWDCINNQSYNAGNFYFADANLAHGMCVSGIIAAKGDAVGATGVAFDSKVVPMLISGSESSILLALQKALEMNVDVVNMSFGIGYSQAVEQQIENLVNLGREKYGEKLGTIIVASSGNDATSDEVSPQWPAAFSQVISVSASTPNDTRKETGDNWNVGSTWGTNYGNMLDLAAPGVCIYTTDISGAAGYSSSDYGGFQKTSAAAPIVSGVVALLLSKNNSLTWQEVRTKMIEGADKVHDDTYNYSADPSRPGHSVEMGYGRVNAAKTLDDTEVGIRSIRAITRVTVTSNNPVYNTLYLKYTMLGNRNRNMTVIISDLTGTVTGTYVLPYAVNGRYSIDVSPLRAGMYLARVVDDNNRTATVIKFIKPR